MKVRAAIEAFTDPARPIVAATRDTALAVYGINRSFPTTVQLALDGQRRRQPFADVTLLRTTPWRAEMLMQRSGITVLKPAPLLRQLSAVRDVRALRHVAIELCAAGLMDLNDLGVELDRHRHFGGRPRLRTVWTELRSAGRTDSALELQVRHRLVAAGIVLDRGQVAVPGTRIHLDLGIASIRFGIEVDSFSFHSSPRDLERDARRSNVIAAQAPDWLVLHVTWQTLNSRWSEFVSDVQAIVARRTEQWRVHDVHEVGPTGRENDGEGR